MSNPMFEDWWGKWGRAESASEFWSANARRFDTFYDLATRWDRFLHQPLQVRHDAAIARVRTLGSPSVCDVGCGTGRQLVAAVDAGARRAVGIDVSSEMIRLAQERVALSRWPARVSLHLGDVLSWEQNEQFDLVWALGVFDYERSPVVLLRKLRALSRSHVLTTFRRIWALRSPFRKLTYGLRGQPIYLHTQSSVRSAFERAGFHEIRVSRLTAGLYVAEGRVLPSGASSE